MLALVLHSCFDYVLLFIQTKHAIFKIVFLFCWKLFTVVSLESCCFYVGVYKRICSRAKCEIVHKTKNCFVAKTARGYPPPVLYYAHQRSH